MILLLALASALNPSHLTPIVFDSPHLSPSLLPSIPPSLPPSAAQGARGGEARGNAFSGSRHEFLGQTVEGKGGREGGREGEREGGLTKV